MSAASSAGPRLLAGLVLAPLTPGLTFLLLSAVEANLGEGFWALRLSAIVGYPAMIVLGLPAHLLLRKFGSTGLWGYAVAGLLIGAIVAAVLFSSVIANNFGLAHDPTKSLTPSVAISILAAFLGMLSAVVFWAIARPDRSAGTA